MIEEKEKLQSTHHHFKALTCLETIKGKEKLFRTRRDKGRLQ